MNSALIFIFLAIAVALFLGIRARRGKDMSLEQWAVGGRGFGAAIVFLLMAGEIYTTFVFLGGSGYAYGHGAGAYYLLGYGSLPFILSYFLLPPIWRYAKERGLISQPDFFASKYNSQKMGVLVAIVGFAALIPYLVLQLKGLGIIVSVSSYSALSANQGVLIGAVVVAVYVALSGVHGSAWTSVVKDALVMFVAIFLGLYLPYHYYGGVGEMFAAIEKAKPGFLALRDVGESPVWMVSTVILSTLGFYMWPHMFMAVYTAKREEVLRRNAFVLPIYQLMLLFILFVGFSAVLAVPGLTGGDIDLALFKVSLQTFDPWFVGVIGAAGVLTALVPGSMILMTSATLLANNVYRPLRPQATDAQVARVAKWLAPAVMALAVLFTLNGGQTIVALLLMAYALVTQLFPALLASLFTKNLVTRPAAFASIIVGEATVAWVSLTKKSVASLFPFLPDALKDLNVGIVALVFNVVTLVVVTLLTRRTATAAQLAADAS
ncbi:sodium:solute symporter family protein [Pandoraea fibrosis]|uniref:Sodium:solute symporter family protein n=1 Tax=Pandoraea fibrosis TaxID=1891094 RepID=A0ABX6HNY7_9BURK|nr:sodium:solute symporter [Pandoraea fibrosis]QHE93817.1 sodium:solute symporter family protein [Pandoraea fibrosis]QHF12621.1 sodium:solute symporter family protein [Pandoraea fibrosis]